MAILVKRFCVRYNGVAYGPGQPGGQIIVGLSEEEEARLIEGSNGTIEKYVPPQASTERPAADDTGGEKKALDPAAGQEGEGEAGAPVGDTEPEPELPAIDPADLIKPKKRR